MLTGKTNDGGSVSWFLCRGAGAGAGVHPDGGSARALVVCVVSVSVGESTPQLQ